MTMEIFFLKLLTIKQTLLTTDRIRTYTKQLRRLMPNPLGDRSFKRQVIPRFELGNKRFAIFGLTAWLYHQIKITSQHFKFEKCLTCTIGNLKS